MCELKTIASFSFAFVNLGFIMPPPPVWVSKGKSRVPIFIRVPLTPRSIGFFCISQQNVQTPGRPESRGTRPGSTRPTASGKRPGPTAPPSVGNGSRPTSKGRREGAGVEQQRCKTAGSGTSGEIRGARRYTGGYTLCTQLSTRVPTRVLPT